MKPGPPWRRKPPKIEPSPVYWAGASLKRVLANLSPPWSLPPSPVYWAGASLKLLG